MKFWLNMVIANRKVFTFDIQILKSINYDFLVQFQNNKNPADSRINSWDPEFYTVCLQHHKLTVNIQTQKFSNCGQLSRQMKFGIWREHPCKKMAWYVSRQICSEQGSLLSLFSFLLSSLFPFVLESTFSRWVRMRAWILHEMDHWWEQREKETVTSQVSPRPGILVPQSF